jgi:hypothetical protein
LKRIATSLIEGRHEIEIVGKKLSTIRHFFLDTIQWDPIGLTDPLIMCSGWLNESSKCQRDPRIWRVSDSTSEAFLPAFQGTPPAVKSRESLGREDDPDAKMAGTPVRTRPNVQSTVGLGPTKDTARKCPNTLILTSNSWRHLWQGRNIITSTARLLQRASESSLQQASIKPWNMADN